MVKSNRKRKHPVTQMAKLEASTEDWGFKDSPLIFVIAQISFTQSPEIISKIADVKSALGNLGLPIAEKTQQVTFTASSSSAPPKVSQTEFWLFSSVVRNRIVSISSNSLVIYDTQYHRFAEFRDRFSKIVDIVQTVAGEGCYTTSIALRYVSGFESGDLPSNLIPLGLHGLPVSCVETSHFHHEYKYWCDVKSGGRLIAIVKTVHGNELIPKDVQRLRLDVDNKFKMHKQTNAISIDINETIQHQLPEKLAAGPVCVLLSKIRGRAKAVFLAVTTGTAHVKWGKS